MDRANHSPGLCDRSEDVTTQIGSARSGDSDATAALWKFYSPMLIQLARRRLGEASGVDHTAQEVAQSAFLAWQQGFIRGEFESVRDSEDLGKLLVVIAIRKVSERTRRANSLKRGGNYHRVDADSRTFVAAELPPDEMVMFADELRRLLDLLDDETLNTVALLRLEGYADLEIAERLGCSRSSVQRKLARIRSLWGDEVDADD